MYQCINTIRQTKKNRFNLKKSPREEIGNFSKINKERKHYFNISQNFKKQGGTRIVQDHEHS
ncbi:MAG: hypothetical protein V1770_06780 [bacterium]